MPNEKDDKTNKNNGVDSRKNLKRKERHANQHSIDGLPNKNGSQVAPNQALGNPQHLQSFNNN